MLDELKAGNVYEASDYCDAATIYQRSDEAANIRMAFALATLCAELQPDNENAVRLQTTTWDRYMLAMGSGQWYATQFEWQSNGEVRPLPMAPHLVSDEDRARYGLRSLRKLTSDLKILNERKTPVPAAEMPTWSEEVPF